MLCTILREYQYTSHRYAQRLRMPDIHSEESQPLNPTGDLPSFMSFGLKPEAKTPVIRKIRNAWSYSYSQNDPPPEFFQSD